MPEDIEYDESLDTYWDDVGDLATIDGQDELQQSIITALIERADLAAPALDPESVGEQKADIVAVLRSHPRVERPIQVRVSETDPQERSVTYQVVANNVSLPLTVGE